MSAQVNLHQHSEGSFLDGLARVDEIATRAAELGQRAVALTDHGDCGQHLAFQNACRRQDIQPLLGMEGYWVNDVAEAKSHSQRNRYPSEQVSHICLIAADQRGLHNLWRLSSTAYTDAYRFHKPWADLALLEEFSEGIFGSDGCLMSRFSQCVIAGDEDGARGILGQLHGIYGDRFFSELHTWQFITPETDEQRRLNAEMTMVNQAKVRLATEMGIPLVVVNDSHHARPEDWEDKETVWALNTRKNPDQGAAGQKADHLMGEDELYQWMARHGISRGVVAEAITNSARIASACTAEIKPTLSLPVFTGTQHGDVAAFLDAVERGFKHKILDAGLDGELYFRRLETESQLIIERGFASYFLVVDDYVRAARAGTWRQYVEPGADKDPMITGPSRGSAGGSLVSYLLGITTIDPIKYGLLFERFLNPARKGLPDIDVDFPQNKRFGIKKYLEARYGHDHVCMMGTITRNGPRAMLRDLGRAMGVSYSEIDRMAKIIDSAIDIVAAQESSEDAELDWSQILAEKGGDLAPYAKAHAALFEKLGKLIGIARQGGVHASGVLINGEPLSGLVPTRVKTGTTTTQLDMHDCEALGGVKFDLLGIRHLDTLDEARKLIAQRHDVHLDFASFGDREFSDPDIWEQIDAGATTGIFQVESPLATRVATQLKPRNELDVAALISVIRPGVKDAGLMDEYLCRRAGVRPVTYDHPMMRQITEDTFGVLVFQEQLIRAAQLLAGFTAAEGDDLRKALGKKNTDVIEAMREKFINGCRANREFSRGTDNDRYAREAAGKIWASINAAGRYAFNKCTSGDCLVRLSASGSDSDGTMSVEDMWRRLHDLAEPGAAQPGEPCRFCGRPSARKGRGQCRRCVAWRTKFRSNHSKRGLKTWSLGDDGRLHPNRIMDVHQNGVQAVWRVTLADGNSITATANHRHMTIDGWREVWELSVGDALLVCGKYEEQSYEPDRVRTTVGERTYAGALLPNDQRNQRGSLGYIDGGHLALSEWTESQEWVCDEIGCGRSRLAGDRIERAHLDGDRTNNEPHNLAMKCASHHKCHDYKINGRRRRGEKGYPVVPTEIVSIEYAGEDMTYDLEMADPCHSWVGNNIVTHNSHAVGYAVLATWEIWTKYYYPHEYLVALLATDDTSTNRYLREARSRDIAVLPPDVNASGAKFTLTDDGIRYGIESVFGVGAAATAAIIERRPYADLADFLERTTGTKAGNKAVVASLIRVGAFDSLEYNPAWDGAHRPSCRARLMQQFHDHRVWMKCAASKRATMDAAQKAAHIEAWYAKHRGDAGFDAEFSIENFDNPDVVYKIEQELVGTFVTVDPMAPYLKSLGSTVIKDPAQIEDFAVGEVFDIGGQLTKIKKHIVQKGRHAGSTMAFLGIAFNDADFDITVFSDTYEQVRTLIKKDAPVACRVIRDDRGCHLSSLIRLDQLWKEASWPSPPTNC